MSVNCPYLQDEMVPKCEFWEVLDQFGQLIISFGSSCLTAFQAKYSPLVEPDNLLNLRENLPMRPDDFENFGDIALEEGDGSFYGLVPDSVVDNLALSGAMVDVVGHIVTANCCGCQNYLISCEPLPIQSDNNPEEILILPQPSGRGN